MSEYASEAYAKIKTVDLKKAHEDGCEDVKRVLKNMYPDVFSAPKEEWVDVTKECTATINSFQGYNYIHCIHDDDIVAHTHEGNIETDKSGYKIEERDNKDFRILKKQ